MQAGGKPEDLEISGQQTFGTHTDTQERGPDTHESEEPWQAEGGAAAKKSAESSDFLHFFCCLVSLGINGTSFSFYVT